MEEKRNVLISGCGALGDWCYTLPLIKKIVDKYGRDNVYFHTFNATSVDTNAFLYILVRMLKLIKEENLISQYYYGKTEEGRSRIIVYKFGEFGELKNFDRETFTTLFNTRIEELKQLNFEKVFISDLRESCNKQFLFYDTTLVDIFEKILKLPIEWYTEHEEHSSLNELRVPGKIEKRIKETLDPNFKYEFGKIFPEEFKLKLSEKYIDLLITPISSNVIKDIPLNLIEYIIDKLKSSNSDINIHINTHHHHPELLNIANKYKIDYTYETSPKQFMDILMHSKVIFSADSGPQSLANILCIPEVGFHKANSSFFLDGLFDSKTRTILVREGFIEPEEADVTLEDMYNYKITEERRNEINTKIYLFIKSTLKNLKRTDMFSIYLRK